MRRPLKLFICSAVTFLGTLVFGFIAFSSILHVVVHDQKALKDGRELRDYYLKVPFPFKFKIYFFNITNPMDVQKGASPVLEEIGPYVYDSYKEKIDIHESKSEDTLSYTPHEIYIYNDKLTSPLSQDDYVTILNPLIVGMVNMVAKDTPPFLTVLNNALPLLFDNPKSVYITTKVRDILFDGITINCTSREFAPKAVCSQVRSQVPGLKEPQRNILLFSLLGPKNGTLPIKVKVSRGIKDIKSLGKVLEINDEKKQSIWSTRRCNTFDGTDGWVFPPFLQKEVSIKMYSTDLCRNMVIYYVEDVDYHGVKGWLYHTHFGDMSSIPEEKCYCPSPKNCLKKGILDLSKCMGVPVYGSLPHFLYSDPSLLNKVKGLKPVLEEHINKIIFEPMTATPLLAHKRLQINIPTQSVSKISLMRNVPSVLHPVVWIDESAALEGKFLKKVSIVFVLLKIGLVIKSIVLFLSVVGMAGAGYMHYIDKKKKPKKSTKSAASDKSETNSTTNNNKQNGGIKSSERNRNVHSRQNSVSSTDKKIKQQITPVKSTNSGTSNKTENSSVRSRKSSEKNNSIISNDQMRTTPRDNSTNSNNNEMEQNLNLITRPSSLANSTEIDLAKNVAENVGNSNRIENLTPVESAKINPESFDMSRKSSLESILAENDQNYQIQRVEKVASRSSTANNQNQSKSGKSSLADDKENQIIVVVPFNSGSEKGNSSTNSRNSNEMETGEIEIIQNKNSNNEEVTSNRGNSNSTNSDKERGKLESRDSGNGNPDYVSRKSSADSSLNSLDKEIDEVNKVFVTLINNATNNNLIEDPKNMSRKGSLESLNSSEMETTSIKNMSSKSSRTSGRNNNLNDNGNNHIGWN